MLHLSDYIETITVLSNTFHVVFVCAFSCLGSGSGTTPCPAGKYRSSTGGSSLSDCTSCSASDVATSTGSTSCVACPAGYSCYGGSSTSACSSGQYSLTGETSCTSCPTGNYCPSTTSAPQVPDNNISNYKFPNWASVKFHYYDHLPLRPPFLRTSNSNNKRLNFHYSIYRLIDSLVV